LTAAPTRREAAAGLTAAVAGPLLNAPEPRRVVSLNPCLDAILVRVADRGQIAALSHYARDPLTSSIAPIARRLPITFESAEEVIALEPDLVLMARHTSPATRGALQRLGVRIELFGTPNTVEESLAQVSRIAALVNRRGRGQGLTQRIEGAIAAAAPPPGQRRLSALVYQSNGFASARGTLVDEMMVRAGLENAATRYGLRRTGNVPLERLLADPPQILLAGYPRPGAPTWADRVLAHPALAAVSARMHRADFPQRLMFCGGPVLIETAAMLAKAREEAVRAGA
jgi:iron complex transport system substrate-binding protein